MIMTVLAAALRFSMTAAFFKIASLISFSSFDWILFVLQFVFLQIFSNMVTSTASALISFVKNLTVIFKSLVLSGFLFSAEKRHKTKDEPSASDSKQPFVRAYRDRNGVWSNSSRAGMRMSMAIIMMLSVALLYAMGHRRHSIMMRRAFLYQ